MSQSTSPTGKEPVSSGPVPPVPVSKTTSSNESISKRFINIVNSSHIRFAWFLSNLIAAVNGFLYLQPLGGPILRSIWYRTTLLGAFSTFSIITYQSLKSYKTATGTFRWRAVLQDDNVHYLYDAFIWLLLPRQLLAPIPFVVFSVFHALTFTSKEILPALGLLPGLAQKLSSFASQHYDLSRSIAASSELLLLVVVVFRAIFWRRWSWITLIAYGLFMKVKSEGSIFTRNVLKDWEVRVDGLVSNEKMPPAVKSYWGEFKHVVKSADSFSIIKKVGSEEQKTN